MKLTTKNFLIAGGFDLFVILGLAGTVFGLIPTVAGAVIALIAAAVYGFAAYKTFKHLRGYYNGYLFQ